MDGYYLNSTNSQCIVCPSECKTCQSIDGCNTCASGFTLTTSSSFGFNGYKCMVCQSPCATCSGSIEQCTSCISGYAFNGWRCTKTFHFAFTITLQTTKSIFNTNYFSFILALAKALGSSKASDVAIFSIKFGSVIVGGAA